MLKINLQKIRTAILAITLAFSAVAMPLVATTAYADTPTSQAQQGVNQVGGTNAGGSLQGFIKNVINILLFVIGAVAVVMIIVGGIRYVVSNGDQSAITGAKNTILYAVVGLVIAVMAYAIVNFVLNNLK